MLALIYWDDFKIFLRYSLEESWVLVDDIWKKIQIANQYLLKKVIDRVVYLDNLQALLKEFNAIPALNKRSLNMVLLR